MISWLQEGIRDWLICSGDAVLLVSDDSVMQRVVTLYICMRRRKSVGLSQLSSCVL